MRTDESNFGSRVDVQGWGRGAGLRLRRSAQDMAENGGTDRFGKSGTSAMVAGAAAIQSIVKARGRALLPATAATGATGTPQSGDLSENIGPRPDLKAAMALLDTNSACTIRRQR